MPDSLENASVSPGRVSCQSATEGFRVVDVSLSFDSALDRARPACREREHCSPTKRHTFASRLVRNRRNHPDESDPGQPLRELQSTCGQIRPRARSTGNGELIKRQSICDGQDIRRPVRDCAARLGIVRTKAGSLENNDPYAVGPGEFDLRWFGKPGAWRAGKPEQRTAAHVPVVSASERSTVRQTHSEPETIREGFNIPRGRSKHDDSVGLLPNILASPEGIRCECALTARLLSGPPSAGDMN